MFVLRVLLCSLLMVVSLQGDLPLQNKIVYLVSPPRSLSVAFLRSMQARGDFEVMNEPSQWAYCSIHCKDIARPWFTENALPTFAAVKQKIIEEASRSNVFVKEMSFAVRDFLLQDKDLVKNKNVHFVFLIRNPHHSTISFYKKAEIVRKDTDKEALVNLLGYKTCYETFDYIKREAVNAPCIVLSENLYSDPQGTMQSLCKFLDIPFTDKMLNWSSLGDSFRGEEWSEIKPLEITQLWHGSAIKSSGFGQPAQYLLDGEGKPSFAEIVDEARREVYKTAYFENLPFYQKFFSEQNAQAILKKLL